MNDYVAQQALSVDELNDMFDDVDDDLLLQASANMTSDPPAGAEPEGEDVVSRIAADDSDDDDDLTKQLMKVRKSRLALDDDDDLVDDVTPTTTAPPEPQPNDVTSVMDFDDDALSVGDAPPVPVAPVAPVFRGFEPTPLQKAFVPASTPVSCAHRFMVCALSCVVTSLGTQ